MRITLKFESPEWLIYLLMDLWVPLVAKLRSPARRLRKRKLGPEQGPK